MQTAQDKTDDTAFPVPGAPDACNPLIFPLNSPIGNVNNRQNDPDD